MIRLSLFSASTAVMYGLSTAAPHLARASTTLPPPCATKKRIKPKPRTPVKRWIPKTYAVPKMGRSANRTKRAPCALFKKIGGWVPSAPSPQIS